MANDNSSDQSPDDNSSDEHEKDNSWDEHEDHKDGSSSDDESKTVTIKKRKAAVFKKQRKKRKIPEDNFSDEHEEERENSSDEEEEYKTSSDEHKTSSEESEEEKSSDDESEEENSSDDESAEETLQILSQRLKEISEEDKDKQSKFQPPDRIIHGVKGLALYSGFIYKQLIASDVNGGHCRLMLGRKEVKDEFFSRLDKPEIPGAEGVDVLVYGRDGKSYEMKLKKRTKKSPVLMNGWSQFVKDYELQKYKDFLKIWMFRGSDEDRKICFAIDSIRADGITKQLSKRILKKAFKD